MTAPDALHNPNILGAVAYLHSRLPAIAQSAARPIAAPAAASVRPPHQPTTATSVARAAAPTISDHAAAPVDVRATVPAAAAPPESLFLQQRRSSITTPRPSTATPPAAYATATEKDDDRAPTGDGPETAPAQRKVRFDSCVKVLEFSSDENCDMLNTRAQVLVSLCLSATPRSLASRHITGPSSARVAAASSATPAVAAHIKANSVSRSRTVASPPLPLIANQPVDRHLAAQARVHRAPCNNAPESSLLVKRRRVDRRDGDCGTAADPSGMFRDVSGRRVTSERLLVVFGASPYISLGYVQEAYSHIYGCELMPRTIPSQERIATLARVVTLDHWAPQLEGEVFEDIAGRNILCRRDLERTELRQNYREQLGLANDPNAAVLGPRLCYIIVKMCSMSVDLLTGPMLRSMFMDVVGLHLQSISIVTEKRVQRMGANSICHMVESWVGNFCKFIAEDFSIDDARSAATQCNAAYATRCGSASDSTDVASDMLRRNEDDSRLFLGNQAADLEEPSKRLFFVASGNTSTLGKDGLEQLAMPLRVQNDSS
ncbi:hypothetical protein GGI13_001029 [Coemansia sp. RSA 455]|nr:hypothetical protein GGI13_001029 [Coemansia sp. RSA 455]